MCSIRTAWRGCAAPTNTMSTSTAIFISTTASGPARRRCNNHLTPAPAPPLNKRRDALLTPASPPARDAFVLRLGAAGLRHGVRAVRQAIAHGQHRYSRGLLYGGGRAQ